ncbi:fumarylacetoacetate hydrolase family protein [Chelativorans sp. AA-79]|uniref:fumarylacetoacetate hydrolase family protein n=1 Tax=Chelativorans sp. AA-79 TaxID=3028735 RepID=UPI0023F94304|nr:fumarylacetoacetate hydrolase family protein [Chelativorans sp. AA-79]WEX12071.1 fumarylacetoacetate hydrolase family protein [Chelativorans sp. AA-79]
MRLTSFCHEDGIPCVGIVTAGGIVDLSRAAPTLPRGLKQLLRAGYSALQAAETAAKEAAATAIFDPGAVTLLPLVPDAGKVLCVGMNYSDHIAEAGAVPPGFPVFFIRALTSLVGHGQAMVVPKVSHQFDYEGELAVVIGKAGRYIEQASALAHVAGYSVFNDGSVRDYQLERGPQWTMGKNFDFSGALGPWLVTPDELPEGGRQLTLQTRLNGQVVQDSNTSNMIYDVAYLIAYASQAMTLEVGDVIVTGTPEGVGFSRKPPIFMKNGDICEVEIEGIGNLRNPVMGEA